MPEQNKDLQHGAEDSNDWLIGSAPSAVEQTGKHTPNLLTGEVVVQTFYEIARTDPAAMALKTQLEQGMDPAALLKSAVEYYSPRLARAPELASSLSRVEGERDELRECLLRVQKAYNEAPSGWLPTKELNLAMVAIHVALYGNTEEKPANQVKG